MQHFDIALLLTHDITETELDQFSGLEKNGRDLLASVASRPDLSVKGFQCALQRVGGNIGVIRVCFSSSSFDLHGSISLKSC